jgi:hypothetical protein
MPDYPTHCFDNLRTGWNSQETVLTPAAIKQYNFGQVGTCAVQGQVYAQPLRVQNVAFADGSSSDVLLIATEENRIYGFDAYTFAKKWERQLLPTGEQLVSSSNVNCNNVSPVIGITSTPVVDPQSKTMYVCAKSKKPGGPHHPTVFHHRLYRINIHNGNDAKPPVIISANLNYAGTTVAFNPQWQLQRPGLLLMNDMVYIGFGSHCDNHAGAYHGWIFAYDSDLNQKGAFVSTISGLGGIWQSGRGLAGDGTSVYCQTGNADNKTPYDLGDSVLKVSIGSPLLQLNGYFTPCDQAQLGGEDADLGSGGPLLFPDQPGPFPHVMVAAGKEGTIYVLNRDTSLGGYTAAPATWNPCNGGGNPTPCANSNLVIQTLWMALGQAGKCDIGRDALFGGPAYFAPDQQANVNTFPRIYYCAQDDFVKAFYFDTTSGQLVGPFQQSTNTIPDGAIPVVSSNGGQNGILWVASRGGPNSSRQLFAYDLNPTLSLSDPNAVLVNGIGAGSYSPEGDPQQSPSLGPPATVANGSVFVAGLNQVVVFGLLSPQPSNCFIASAVVDPASPMLMTLRTFRDQYLATNNPGRRFLNLYETFSPTVANFIEKRRSLRTVARVLVVRPSCLFARVLLAIRKPRT